LKNHTLDQPRRILLRSSWQTINIGDIAHTPGMLALLEKHCPAAEVTLWPNPLSAHVEKLLTTRFPKLRIAATGEAQQAALQACDFVLHGSGPMLLGADAAEQARALGKPYGFGGVTLHDFELTQHRQLLESAKFIFTRDTLSLEALRKAGIQRPKTGFGPDATFALDLRDEPAADQLLQQYELEKGKFLCAIPRLRWTPYWELHPEQATPNPECIAENQRFAESDHARMREAIIAWVKELQQPVFLVPEMSYAVALLKPLLFDPLPAEVKPYVRVLDRYWLTAEAASVYARAAALISFELHSPIMAVTAGTPAIHLRQPTDTRKGQMWRDVGLSPWIFEIEHSSGPEIASRLVQIGQNLAGARALAEQAHAYAQVQMAAMIAEISVQDDN